MSDFATTYRRRVEKYFNARGVVPKIAPEGTNHIDDAGLWDDMTIYKGEVIFNLGDGGIYTSDNKSIIKLGRRDGIQDGMQLIQAPGGFSGGIKRWLAITDGFASINGRKFKFISSLASASNGDIQVSENNSSLGRYDIIYATPTTEKYNTTDTNFKLEIKTFDGPLDINEIINNKVIEDIIAFENSDVFIILGMVFVPGTYSDTAVTNMLRPWSVSKTNNLVTYNDGTSTTSISVSDINITGIATKPILNVMPSDLIYLLSTSFFIDEHTEPINSKKKRVYIEGQLVISNISIFKILKTHFCGTSLEESEISGDAIKILGGGGGGGGGVDEHNLLSALGYDQSGHTGFQRSTHIFPRDPGDDDSSAPTTSGVKADVGNLWLNSVADDIFICVDATPNAASWMRINTSVKSTPDDKDVAALETLNDNDLASNHAISNTPLNESYVEVLLNGVKQSLGDGIKTKNCYFSDDGGVTAKSIDEIEDLDELYWNGTEAGHQLSANDKISFIYIVGISGTWSSTGLSGPLWGGDSITP